MSRRGRKQSNTSERDLTALQRHIQELQTRTELVADHSDAETELLNLYLERIETALRYLKPLLGDHAESTGLARHVQAASAALHDALRCVAERGFELHHGYTFAWREERPKLS